VVSIQPILASLGEPAQAPRIAPAARMTTNTPEPEPRYERYRVAYPSETVVQACHCDGATLGKVRVTHPLAGGRGHRGFIGKREVNPIRHRGLL
jgi:hypothetical protein